jgi:hypothetical protein
MSTLQVLPRHESPTGGVGFYAQGLGDALSSEGIGNEPLSVPGEGRTGLERSESLFRDLEQHAPDVVLLHYVGYGYAPDGAPRWLVEALERWRSQHRGSRLVTIFHEVYASGPPWRRAFWHFAAQRRLAARLFRLSDAAVTTVDLYAEILSQWGPREKITVLPVFSTVGEPQTVPAPGERNQTIALFGGAGNRRRAYGRFRADLERAVRTLEITEILDLGAPADAPSRVAGIPVRQLGVLTASEVSGHLLQASAGFLSYPPALLGKSTVYAAYCAHGVLPVCAAPRPAGHALPHWSPRDPLTHDLRETLPKTARSHYSEHSLAVQAARMGSLLRRPANGGGDT